jgi:hypothetical protein
MRRQMEWKTRRPDGTAYEVRVGHFSKEFKFQFREKGSETWDYKRKPTREDMEDFLDNVQRRYQRREATHEELVRAQRMLAEFIREE